MGGGVRISAAAQASLKQGATAVALGSIIMNILFKGLINSLLSIISSLGIIMHLFLVPLNYPVEMMDFCNLLFPLITFDVFPVGSLYEKWFHFTEITTDYALT